MKIKHSRAMAARALPRLLCAVALILGSITAAFAVEVPERAKEHQPILAKHQCDTKIQIVPWGTPLPTFLDEAHIHRFADHTVFAGPPGAYMVMGDGQIAFVIVEAVKPPEPPKPDPDTPTPPGPSPDVPADPFDNLGQRVATWAAGLEGRGSAAAVYRAAAKSLRENPSKTIDDTGADVVKGLNEAINYASYATLRAHINADLQARWPLSRGLMADYYDAIAAGLEAGK